MHKRCTECFSKQKKNDARILVNADEMEKEKGKVW